MALINCPECNKEISNKASVCIHCGCPVDIDPSKAIYCYKKGIQNLSLRCSCGFEFKYMNTFYGRTVLDNGDYKFNGELPIICPRCNQAYGIISFSPV